MTEAKRHEGVRVQAVAKINLSLNVIGRREDGYHLIDSLVVFAGVGDCLEAYPASAFGLEIDGPFGDALGPERNNLVSHAAQEFAERAGRSPTVRIRLEKNLPVAAGIGGGSADAAATLRALGVLWGFPLDHPDVADLALSLGGDVPICLLARPAFVSGIGEFLTEVSALPNCHLVLANPGVPLSTAAVFAARSGPYSQPPPRLDGSPRDAATLADWLHAGGNDLTQAACEAEPVIVEVIDRIGTASGCLLARMSGSGPTCFGLFASERAARAAAAQISADRPRWWVRAAPVLEQRPEVHRPD